MYICMDTELCILVYSFLHNGGQNTNLHPKGQYDNTSPIPTVASNAVVKRFSSQFAHKMYIHFYLIFKRYLK